MYLQKQFSEGVPWKRSSEKIRQIRKTLVMKFAFLEKIQT